MPSISFGKTTDRFLAAKKSVTRRDWKQKTVNTFIKAYHNQTPVLALDKSYRNGGKPIGKILLTQEPYWEMLKDMSKTDVAFEGYPELSKKEFIDKFFEGIETKMLCVVRFKLLGDIEKEIEEWCDIYMEVTGDAAAEQEKIKKIYSDDLGFERSRIIEPVQLSLFDKLPQIVEVSG